MWLALSGLYRARWTQEIHHEWKRNLLKNRSDLSLELLDRTSQLMALGFLQRQGLVESVKALGKYRAIL